MRDRHFSGSEDGASSSLDDKPWWWRRGEGGIEEHGPLDSTKRSEERNGLVKMDEYAAGDRVFDIYSSWPVIFTAIELPKLPC